MTGQIVQYAFKWPKRRNALVESPARGGRRSEVECCWRPIG